MKAATEAYVTGRPEPKPKKVLSHIVVRQGEKGGHVIEHHHEHYSHEPEHYIFGQQEGPEAHAHIAKYMDMKMPAAEPQSPDEEMEEETGKGD